MFRFKEMDTPLQVVTLDFLGYPGVVLHVLREDLIHPHISGNKYRKLYYNIIEARNKGYKTLLSFGGAYSNHIAALAAVGKEMGFKTIGVIRGDELAHNFELNPTLSFARDCGMELYFVSREEYRFKEKDTFLKNLKEAFGDFYWLPEGGTNALAVKGCEYILSERTINFNTIAVAVGTGGTMAGLVRSAAKHQHIIGFSALKGVLHQTTIDRYTAKHNYSVVEDHTFGGYGKIDHKLVRFINEFKKNTEIPLDPIYTGKMMYGLLKLLEVGRLKKNSRILAIHTGGLQGIQGMNQLLKKKHLPQIE